MLARNIRMCLVVAVIVAVAGSCKDEESPVAPSNVDTSPKIGSILPPGASPGIHVKITGSKFGGAQGGGTVVVGGAAAVVDAWNDTEVEFTMPAGAAGELGVAVTLTTDAGRSVATQIDITPPNTYKVTRDGDMDHYPCWDANGGRIYFSSTRGDGNWNLWRIPAMGGVAQQVTSGDSPDFYPAVNFSSGELAWSSRNKFSGMNPEGDYEIFRGYPICTDPGTACTTSMLTDNQSRDLYPAWAKAVYGGYSMAYTWEEVDQGGGYLAWRVMLVSSGGAVALTIGEQPSFSPDGRWVVYSNEGNLYKISSDGGVPVQLTSTGGDRHPDWGGGDKIVFERSNGGNFEDIFAMNADGTGVEAIVGTRSNEYRPRWSNDYSKVVYYALVTGSFDIFVYVVP